MSNNSTKPNLFVFETSKLKAIPLASGESEREELDQTSPN